MLGKVVFIGSLILFVLVQCIDVEKINDWCMDELLIFGSFAFLGGVLWALGI